MVFRGQKKNRSQFGLALERKIIRKITRRRLVSFNRRIIIYKRYFFLTANSVAKVTSSNRYDLLGKFIAEFPVTFEHRRFSVCWWWLPVPICQRAMMMISNEARTEPRNGRITFYLNKHIGKRPGGHLF